MTRNPKVQPTPLEPVPKTPTTLRAAAAAAAITAVGGALVALGATMDVVIHLHL